MYYCRIKFLNKRQYRCAVDGLLSSDTPKRMECVLTSSMRGQPSSCGTFVAVGSGYRVNLTPNRLWLSSVTRDVPTKVPLEEVTQIIEDPVGAVVNIKTKTFTTLYTNSNLQIFYSINNHDSYSITQAPKYFTF